MNTRNLLTLSAITAVVLLFVTGLATAQAPDASPLGSGFTYQGQLKTTGNP